VGTKGPVDAKNVHPQYKTRKYERVKDATLFSADFGARE